MDAPVDFSLDRARLLNGNLVSSALGSYNGGSYGEAGHAPALNRSTATGLASTSSLSEIARVGTPATLTSVEQYQARYLHPSLSFSTPDAGYAMMSNYLGAGGPGTEHLKSLMPDMQQCWSAHGDGLPRYFVNNNSIYPSYLSYLPATESLSLFAQNASAPGAPYHRIYDLHKEALFHAPGGSIFNTVSPGVSSHVIRQTTDQLQNASPVKKETGVRTNDSKRTLDLSKQSPKLSELNNKNKTSREQDKKDEIKKTERQSDSTKQLSKHTDTKRDLKRTCEFSPTRSKKAKLGNAKDTDSENKKQAKFLTKEEANFCASTCKTSEGKIESEKEAKSAELSIKVSKADGLPSSQKSISPSSSDAIGVVSFASPHGLPSETVNSKQSSTTANTTTTFSLPYYHSIYSHSQPSGTTDGKRVHAPTFTPEIVTLPSVVSIAALPVQTVACDMRIKKEKSSSPHAFCKQTNVVTTNVGLCQPNSKIHDSISSSSSNSSEPLEPTQKEWPKKESEKEKKDEGKPVAAESNIRQNESHGQCNPNSQKSLVSESFSISTASVNSNAQELKVSGKICSDAPNHKSKDIVQPIVSTESASPICINDLTKRSTNGSLNEENNYNHNKMSKVHSPVAMEPPCTSGNIKPSDLRTVCSVSNSKETNQIISGPYDKRDDKSPCKAINLTKEKVVQSPPILQEKVKEKTIDQHDIKQNERILYKKSEFSSSTKKRSDRSGKRDSKKDTANTQDSNGTTGMSNIPIGIAVAQKRELKKETTELSTESSEAGTVLTDSISGHHGDSQSSGNGQSTTKSTTPCSTVTDMRNQLPANLIVTGSANGTGVAWADDPSARHFVSPWIQSGHALNTAHWLGQMPFAVNPSIPTSGTIDTNSQLPMSIPPGYKLVQDSVTGQLVFIPSNIDVYDPNRLWSFPSGHPGTFPQIYAAHQPNQLQHSVLSQHQERQPTDFAIAVQQYQQLHMLQNRTNSITDTKPIVSLPCKMPEHPVVQSENASVKEIQTICKLDTSSTKIGTGKDKVSSQLPNPDSSVLSSRNAATYSAVIPTDLSCPVSIATSVKVEPSTVQSRGTSPMVPASECEDTPQDKIDETSNSSVIHGKDIANGIPNGNTNNVASVQTETVEKSCSAKPVPSTDCINTKDNESVQTDKNVSIEKDIKEPPVDNDKPCTDKRKGESKALPTTTVIDNVTIVEMTPKPKSNLASYSDNKSCIEKENVTKTKDEPSEVLKPRGVESYNPFLDPQILQAADGLELLSALAEQRAKCVSVDNEPNLKQDQLLQFPNKKSEPKQDKGKLFSNEKETKANPKPKRKNFTSRTRSIPPVKTSCKNDSSSYYTSTGLRIPQETDLDSFLEIGEEEINAIELDMRIRLAELQRQYKEKQKQLAKLQPRKDKEKEDFSKQRGPGRPKKRKHHSGSTSDLVNKTPPNKGKDPPTKKKKQAEELVDRVFRKTGGGFGMPLSKKLKANAMAALFKTQSGFTMKRKGSTSGTRTNKPGKQLLFGESKLFQQSQEHSNEMKIKAKRSKLEEESEKAIKKISSKEKINDTSSIDNVEMGSKSITFGNTSKSKIKNENGLGLLATYAAKELNESTIHKKVKKKREEDECKDTTNESECRSKVFTDSQKSPTNHPNITDTIKQRDSDPDVSCDSSTHEYKKRKPGRPRKCTPDQTNSGTETIVAKNSKNFQIFQMQSFREQWNDNMQHQTERKPKLQLENQQPMKPIFLDEEWLRRRSERIFLSDPSPQPSPNINISSQQASQKFQTYSSTSVKQKSEKAKLQKARNIHELTQRVKKKYSKKFQKNKSIEKHEKRKIHKKPPVISDRESDSSESDGDNIPLSILRDRPSVPEPRSCVIDKDELKDGLRVLVFKDGLFYEGAVKGIRPPDVYGVIVDNARGNRPYIYSQEEILKEAIIDVKPSSIRYLKEGTRVCAYWSQQFSCLYPGTVAKASPNPHADKGSINVEFDDGDSGRIPLDHIRMLAQDFPLVSYDPNPLLLIGKRRRHTTAESVESKKSERTDSPSARSIVKRGPGRPPKPKQDSVKEKDDEEDIDVCGLDEENDDVFTSSFTTDDTKKQDQKKCQKHSSGKVKRKHKNKEKDGSTKTEIKNREKGDNSRNNSNSSSDQAFQPARQLWHWFGKSTKRPGMKGKAKKEFYKSIVRGKEQISVGDCAVFLSTGRPHLPYVGRIDSMWEAWGGQMVVKVKWFYHPEETRGGKKLQDMKGALFQSPHIDENDVQTISHKCDVMSYTEYSKGKTLGMQTDGTNVYYLAGTYEPTIGLLKFEEDLM